jgi:hypothetical protein
MDGKAIMKLRTGELFSATKGDYFMKSPDFKLRGYALVQQTPLRRKGFLLASGWKVLKINPKIKDLI